METQPQSQDGVRRVIHDLAERLRVSLGDNLREIRLYGSWARGKARRDSDIDLAVIVRESDFHTWKRVQTEAGRLSLAYDVVLSVNLLSQREWDELCRLRTLYARQLQEEGVLL